VAKQFPPLVGSEWVLGGDWNGDNHLVKIMLQGLQGPIQVMGEPYNNAMPQWQQLKDDQIALILTYIRTEWGNAAPPITPEFVAAVRESTGVRTEPWTQTELQAIPKQVISDAAPAPAAPSADPNAPAPESPAAVAPAAAQNKTATHPGA